MDVEGIGPLDQARRHSGHGEQGKSHVGLVGHHEPFGPNHVRSHGLNGGGLSGYNGHYSQPPNQGIATRRRSLSALSSVDKRLPTRFNERPIFRHPFPEQAIHGQVPFTSNHQVQAVALQAHVNAAAAAAQHVQKIAFAVAQDAPVHLLAPPAGGGGGGVGPWAQSNGSGYIVPPPSPGSTTFDRQDLSNARSFTPTYGQPTASSSATTTKRQTALSPASDAALDRHISSWISTDQSPRKGRADSDGGGSGPGLPQLEASTKRRYSLPKPYYPGSRDYDLRQPNWMAEYEIAYAAQLSAIANGIYQQEHDNFMIELTRAHPVQEFDVKTLAHSLQDPVDLLEAQATQLAQNRAAAVVAGAQAQARASSVQTIQALQGLAMATDQAQHHKSQEPSFAHQADHRSMSISHQPMHSASSADTIDNGLLRHVVHGDRRSGRNAQDEEHRDQLLGHAHALYSQDAQNPSLLPLLHTLHKLHPNHLPILLLLACVYYTRGNHNSSLYYNHHILSLDRNYVEAMSNIGTTLRSLGKNREAESWWYRALEIRPGYWDAVENLVGVLCSVDSPEKGKEAVAKGRYEEALRVCDFVEAKVLGPSKELKSQHQAFVWPQNVPKAQAARLQNLYYARGNLRYAMGQISAAKVEYEKAMEVVLGGLSLVEVLLGLTIAAGKGQCHNRLLEQVTQQVGVQGFALVWKEVQSYRDDLLQSFGQEGIPYLLLLPDQVSKLAGTLFASTKGVLPSLVSLLDHPQPGLPLPPAITQANQTSSTILLTLAKLYQDSLANPKTSQLAVSLPLQGLAPTTSMLLPLYYLSLALHPSPSTCNNLGILLSTLPHSAEIILPSGQAQVFNGQALALQYYTYGLQLDQRHPHLYTNLGSLLKDMGHLNEAVRMYEKAVDCNPNFDVALANLGNAIKDMGRLQDSIPWYTQAVTLNPNFAEAVCGLVNALGGVCDWKDRGGAEGDDQVVDVNGQLISTRSLQSTNPGKPRFGWMGKVLDTVDRQIAEGSSYGTGFWKLPETVRKWSELVATSLQGTEFWSLALQHDWKLRFEGWIGLAQTRDKNGGGLLVRLVERLIRRIQRKWYIDAFGRILWADQPVKVEPDQLRMQAAHYLRPMIPGSLSIPPVPTVLPFHTFTYPLSAREIRLISHRNALRISHVTLAQSWVPAHVYPPPLPPVKGGKLNIGYVSSDFNNHPLSHLMQSVFGFHDLGQFNVFLYATSASDGSQHRQKIEREAQHFIDVSTLSTSDTVSRIVSDKIHVLINLNGYTKGAKNEIFAVRPCPVQMSFMGFAGTLGAGWCDYIIADPVVCPPSMVSPEVWQERQSRKANGIDATSSVPVTDFEGDLDPEETSDSWVYTEKFLYMPHSYFVNDHKQGFRDEVAELVAHPEHASSTVPLDQQPGVPSTRLPGLEDNPEADWIEEQDKRLKMRQELFPDLPQDYVIFANFNQLYKIDPVIFKIWLRILERIPKSILWLLRFPSPGEVHLRKTAEAWSNPAIASRIIFTDVAMKHIHIHRGRVADLFLDTPECNAHTTAADILWSGTPILTYPKYMHKMCSRVATSIVKATGLGHEMIVHSETEYEEKAVSWSQSYSYQWISDENLPASSKSPGASGEKMHYLGRGDLIELRRKLFLSRETSRLFDTKRWVRNLEKGLIEAWERWVDGREFEELRESTGMKGSSSIWIADSEDGIATLDYTGPGGRL